MTHLLSSSDVIYTRVIKRDGRTGLVHPGCLLLRILLPCRIMTPVHTRLCQSVLDCVPFGLMSTVYLDYLATNCCARMSEWFCVLCNLSDGGVFQEWKDVHHLILCKFHVFQSRFINNDVKLLHLECICSRGLKGCVKCLEHAWCISLFMHP